MRLKFNRSESKRIANMENEGGVVGYDDVPDKSKGRPFKSPFVSPPFISMRTQPIFLDK